MPSVEEILKQTGLSDEQIKALDPKAMAGFTQVVTSAQQQLDAAELAKRSVSQKWDEEISPALDSWGNEKARLDAEVAFYKAQLEGAKAGGFVATPPPGTPPATPPARTPDGKFVAGNSSVPGSPDFVKLRDDIGGAFAFAADTSWKYRSLFGTEMPDSPTTIIREAAAQRMAPGDYAAKKYDFAGKEKAKREDEQKKHDDAIRKEAVDEVTRKFAEQGGNNPNVRQAEASKFSTLQSAVKEGTRPDPLKMTREQRHAATGQTIRKEIAANETVQ